MISCICIAHSTEDVVVNGQKCYLKWNKICRSRFIWHQNIVQWLIAFMQLRITFSLIKHWIRVLCFVHNLGIHSVKDFFLDEEQNPDQGYSYTPKHPHSETDTTNTPQSEPGMNFFLLIILFRQGLPKYADTSKIDNPTITLILTLTSLVQADPQWRQKVLVFNSPTPTQWRLKIVVWDKTNPHCFVKNWMLEQASFQFWSRFNCIL